MTLAFTNTEVILKKINFLFYKKVSKLQFNVTDGYKMKVKIYKFNSWVEAN